MLPAEVGERQGWRYQHRSGQGLRISAALATTEVSPCVIYDLRHTRITRWAKILPLPVVQELAGHTSISTTMRYAHLNDADVLAAITKAEEEKSGHTFEHTGQNTTAQAISKVAVTN